MVTSAAPEERIDDSIRNDVFGGRSPTRCKSAPCQKPSSVAI